MLKLQPDTLLRVKMIHKKVVIFTDGASRGNPGPAAIGVVIQDENGHVLDTISLCLGRATNNQAEYRAIIAGLEQALKLGVTEVELRSDSELVVRQLSGEYRVKNALLAPLFKKTEDLCRGFSSFKAGYIPREKNAEADKLANQALDGAKNSASALRDLNTVTVRPASRPDFKGIVEIMSETEKIHVAGAPWVFRVISSQQKTEDLERALQDKSGAILVAEAAGKILGYIQISLKENENIHMLKARRYVKVQDLAVKQEFRRSGAGRALMQTAEAWAKAKGVDIVELNVWEFNGGAFSFYQKMGYSTIGRGMWKKI
jgi:ribonuclease HI/GNAT superfamily N-acetyltransferase